MENSGKVCTQCDKLAPIKWRFVPIDKLVACSRCDHVEKLDAEYAFCSQDCVEEHDALVIEDFGRRCWFDYLSECNGCGEPFIFAAELRQLLPRPPSAEEVARLKAQREEARRQRKGHGQKKKRQNDAKNAGQENKRQNAAKDAAKS